MPMFVHLITLTDDGRTTFVDGPVPRPAETAQQYGGEILSDYLTLGRYDVVSVSSFPDAESAARFALAMNAGGQTRTETLRAFDTDEFREIVAGVDDSAGDEGT